MASNVLIKPLAGCCCAVCLMSDSAKAKILGVNASRLYDIDLTAVDRPDASWLPAAQDELGSRLA